MIILRKTGRFLFSYVHLGDAGSTKNMLISSYPAPHAATGGCPGKQYRRSASAPRRGPSHSQSSPEPLACPCRCQTASKFCTLFHIVGDNGGDNALRIGTEGFQDGAAADLGAAGQGIAVKHRIP